MRWKVCTKCRESRPVREFYRRPESASGWSSWCKGCHRAAMRENQRRRYAEDPAYRERRLAMNRRNRARRRGLPDPPMPPPAETPAQREARIAEAADRQAAEDARHLALQRELEAEAAAAEAGD